MGIEIERKFLVRNTDWKQNAQGVLYRQGYLSSDKQCTVRVRIAGDSAFVTIKGITTGISRLEFEYPIPLGDAVTMLDKLCAGALIEKTRYRIEHAGNIWEVDEFAGANSGLVLAEIELHDEAQAFEKPHWLGEEVSGDPRYFNSNLAKFGLNREKLTDDNL